MKEQWYVTLWRFGFRITTRVLLPIMFVALPILVVVGFQKPDRAAIAALHLDSNQRAVLVGVGGGERCVAGECTQVSTHTYLIWPGFSGAAVTEDGDRVAVTRGSGDGIAALLVWLLGGWCVWRYWVKLFFRGNNTRRKY